MDAGGGAAGSFVTDTDVSGGNTSANSEAIDTSQVSTPTAQRQRSTAAGADCRVSIQELGTSQQWREQSHQRGLTMERVGQWPTVGPLVGPHGLST